MSDADRQRWNLRYSSGTADMAPNGWLVEHEALIRPRQAGQRALDLACGMGQNALYLARLGYQVDAWDISDVALEGLRAALAVAGEGLAVTLRQVDLDVAAISPATYDLVLDLNFLERRLFGEMAAALRPGGILMLRALMHRAVGDERTPAYLLERGELRDAFGRLEILEYVEDPVDGWAAMVGAVYDAAWRGRNERCTPLGSVLFKLIVGSMMPLELTELWHRLEALSTNSAMARRLSAASSKKPSKHMEQRTPSLIPTR